MELNFAVRRSERTKVKSEVFENRRQGFVLFSFDCHWVLFYFELSYKEDSFVLCLCADFHCVLAMFFSAVGEKTKKKKKKKTGGCWCWVWFDLGKVLTRDWPCFLPLFRIPSVMDCGILWLIGVSEFHVLREFCCIYILLRVVSFSWKMALPYYLLSSRGLSELLFIDKSLFLLASNCCWLQSLLVVERNSIIHR